MHITGGSTRRVRTLAGAGVLAVVASGLVVAQATADGPPQRVLQSVRIDLGADGAVHGIESTDVRRVEGRKATSDEHRHEPRETVDQLPVRVTTAYRTAEGSGTDLRDLKGYDGTVQIDVTVQNSTVRPELISYDVAGARRQQYALVGVPMTVVAAADLGEGTVSRVVTTSDTGRTVTNGVLSQTKDGRGQVQWAAVLAPPQLAPSVTFTLVQEARDFTLPDLDLGVQLGMATDTSIEGLVGAAFGDRGASDELRLQSETIGLIGKVTSVLGEAGTQLNEVREQLRFSAGTLGTRTVEDLKASTETVASATEQLSGELDALAGDLTSALRTTQSAAVSQLRESVGAVQSLLGDTSAKPAAPVVTGAGCTAEVTNKPQAASVWGQLNEVITQLDGLASATGRCSDTIRARLLETVGSTDLSQCDSVTSATCLIGRSADLLGEIVTAVAADGDDAVQVIQANGVTQVTNERFADLAAAVVALQQQAADLRGSSQDNQDDVQALRDKLDAVNASVGAVRSSLAQKTDQLDDALADLRALAEQGLGQVGATEDAGGSIRAQVVDLATEICRLQTSQGLSDLDVRRLRVLTTGTSCDGNPTGLPGLEPDPLTERLADQAQRWSDLVAGTDPSSSAMAGLATSIRGLDTDLAGIQTAIGEARALVGDNTRGNVNRIVDAINALYDAPLPEDPEGTEYDDLPVNLLGQAIGGITGRQDALAQAITDAFDQYERNLADHKAAVEAQIPVIDQQRQLSDGDIAALFATATDGLTEAGDTIAKRGKAAIDSQKAKVGGQVARFEQLMDRSTRSALASIDKSVGSANGDLAASEKLLTRDLQSVLTDLGSREQEGSGLLGIIEQQAAQTRTSTARIGTANDQATEFGNVRGEDLGGVYLEQAQLQRALELQAAFPAFALELPEGSQHVTVYSFHVRGVK